MCVLYQRLEGLSSEFFDFFLAGGAPTATETVAVRLATPTTWGGLRSEERCFLVLHAPIITYISAMSTPFLEFF